MLPLLRNVQTGIRDTSILFIFHLFYLDSDTSLGTGDGRRRRDISLLLTWVWPLLLCSRGCSPGHPCSQADDKVWATYLAQSFAGPGEVPLPNLYRCCLAGGSSSVRSLPWAPDFYTQLTIRHLHPNIKKVPQTSSNLNWTFDSASRLHPSNCLCLNPWSYL